MVKTMENRGYGARVGRYVVDWLVSVFGGEVPSGMVLGEVAGIVGPVLVRLALIGLLLKFCLIHKQHPPKYGNSGVAQRLAYQAHNLGVGGSKPLPATFYLYQTRFNAYSI